MVINSVSGRSLNFIWTSISQSRRMALIFSLISVWWTKYVGSGWVKTFFLKTYNKLLFSEDARWSNRCIVGHFGYYSYRSIGSCLTRFKIKEDNFLYYFIYQILRFIFMWHSFLNNAIGFYLDSLSRKMRSRDLVWDSYSDFFIKDFCWIELKKSFGDELEFSFD